MCKENALINLEFEGRKLDYIIGEDGEPLFELYNVGMMLGYVVITKGKEYPTKKRIEKVVENAEITGVLHGVKLSGTCPSTASNSTSGKKWFMILC